MTPLGRCQGPQDVSMKNEKDTYLISILRLLWTGRTKQHWQKASSDPRLANGSHLGDAIYYSDRKKKKALVLRTASSQ